MTAEERGTSEAPRDDAAGERRALVGRAGLVSAGTLASRLLGLVRDASIAASFGRRETDAFWIAFTIPNALRQLLAEGAVSSAVVPVLSARLAEEGDAAGQRFFARARAVSLVALVVTTALGVAFAGPLTELFAGGFRDVPGQLERTTTLTRLVFPYIFFMGTAALGAAALHAKRRFGVASFAPALLNVAMIAACFGLPGLFAARGLDPVLVLAVGALVGGLLQVLAQLPALRALGFAGRPRLDLRDPHVRTMLRRIAPMTFGLGVYYVDLVLSRRLLSGLGEGSQSYFSWAMRVADFPQGIFVMALSTAALPSLAALAAKDDVVELRRTFWLGLRLALFVSLPASLACVVLGEPVVALLFQRGQFDADAVRETARSLAWQGGAIACVATVRQAVSLLHARGETRVPVVVSAVDLVVFVALALGLRGRLGHVGVAVAVFGSTFVQMGLLLVAVRRGLGGLGLRRELPGVLGMGVSALVAAFAARGVADLARAVAPRALVTTVPGLAGALVFLALYLATARALRVPELGLVAAPLARRLGLRRAT